MLYHVSKLPFPTWLPSKPPTTIATSSLAFQFFSILSIIISSLFNNPKTWLLQLDLSYSKSTSNHLLASLHQSLAISGTCHNETEDGADSNVSLSLKNLQLVTPIANMVGKQHDPGDSHMSLKIVKVDRPFQPMQEIEVFTITN